MRIAAISRGHRYSPNHIENDALILKLTIENLEKQGFIIELFGEDEISIDLLKEFDVIFSMIRSRYALDILKSLEKRGTIIINKTRGVANCYRARTAEILPANNIPFPKSYIIDCNKPLPNFDLPSINGSFKVWIKRGDVHAIHREDVTLVYSREELESTVREYHRRGIIDAVVQEQIDGDVVKFYAVRNSDFFHWYYHPGSRKLTFNENELSNIAARCADILDVDIYGGDAVIDPSGNIFIIDLNDWPSFAPIRNKASEYISELIKHKILNPVI